MLVLTHTSGVTSNMLSAGTSDGWCCSLSALFHIAQKKYKLLFKSSVTVVSHVIGVMFAEHRVLYWLTWLRRSVVRVAAL